MFKRILENLLSIGADETDSESLRLKKSSLLMVPLIIGPLAFIWGMIYIYLDHSLSASIPLSYFIISLFNLWHMHQTKNINVLYSIQMTLVLILPFLLMWSLGGFAASSFVFIWAFFAPVAALTYEDDKRVSYWFYGFIALLIFSTVIDTTIAKLHVDCMPQFAIEIFYFLNIAAGFSGLYFLVKYFINEKEKNKNKSDVQNFRYVNNSSGLDRHTIIQVIIHLALIILIIEIGIMQLLSVLPYNLSSLQETLLDAIMLVAFSSPIIYLFVIKPFIIITDKSKEEVAFLAYHDRLTSLPNKVKLLERLKDSISSHVNKDLSIILLDIDSMKYIQESFGLKAVEYSIEHIIARFNEQISTKATLARVEENQFAFLLEDIQLNDELYAISKNILKILATPLTYEGHKITLGGSIGISRYLKDAHTHEDMLNFAYTAMRKAKSFEADKISFYTQSLTEAVHAIFILEQDMRVAIENNEFFLLYQPKIDAKTNKLMGVEALIRWNHPQKGLISPVDFIPIAEESGLILQVGEWVIHEALKMLEKCIDSGIKPFKMSINLSAKQINLQEIKNIIEIIRMYRIPVEYIEFELTETSLMKDISQSQALLDILNKTGVSISMDDFGTGYSSLAYLKKFKIDTIKIDRMLVKDIEYDNNDFAIVKAIIVMSHTLNLKVVAEGTETKEQVDMLRELGCDYFQGFYFSKPVKASELVLS